MTEKRLILGQVDTDFNPELDIPAGPWCFAGAEHVYEGWDELDFISTFETADDIHVDAALCAALVHRKAEMLASEFNQIHRRNYSKRYWSTLSTPWLLSMVQASWISYRHLSKLIEKHERITVNVVNEEVVWEFREISDIFKRGSLNLSFVHWLYSMALRHLAPESWTLSKETFNFPPSPKAWKRGWVRSVFRKILGDRLRVINLSGAGILDRFYLSLILYNSDKTEVPPTRNYDTSAAGQAPGSFLNFLDDVLTATRPYFLGEGYGGFEAKAKKRHYAPGKALVGPDMLGGIEDIFVTAHAIESGMRVVAVQHGGNYGMVRTDIDAELGEYSQDQFITWGWNEHGDYNGRFTPLPSPLLSQYHMRHKERRDQLILVSGQHHLVAFRVSSWPQPLQWIEMRNEKLSFFRGLSKEIFSRTYYRPYFDDGPSLETRNYFLNQLPSLNIIEDNLHSAMMTCRLLVLDHPGTTLNLAMAANVPVICFWKMDAWPETKEMEGLIKKLIQVGILYERGDKTAAAITEIWEDVASWWGSAEVQKVRTEFCSKLARSSPNWRSEWKQALSTI